MNRRGFCTALALACMGRGADAYAQRQPVLIGFLHFGSRKANENVLAWLREGLAVYGWKDGAQLVIDDRWADGQLDRMQRLAEELAARKPALIVATSARSTAALVEAAPQTAIVLATGADPVAAGFAKSLARPGGMVTGLTNVNVDATEKLLELLLTTAPKLRRVGFLLDANYVNHSLYKQAAQRAAARHGVEARYAELARAEDIDAAIERLAAERMQGMVVLGGILVSAERPRIVARVVQQRWPAIATFARFAEDGLLLSYGVDNAALYRRAGYYIDRILKGARPGDLPIEQPTKFELVVNAKAARGLGLAVPQPVLLQATRVIE